MYGSGRSEEMIGEAIAPCNREELFLVSKVYPQNAGKARLEKSLDQSLRLLGTDYLTSIFCTGEVEFRFVKP